MVYKNLNDNAYDEDTNTKSHILNFKVLISTLIEPQS